MAVPIEEILSRLRAESARMAGLVQKAVEDAAAALVGGNAALAADVVALDDDIDEAEVEVEKIAIDLLSLYRPAAGEFRLALMVVKVNNELERIADGAANVAERVPALLAECDDAGEAYRLPDELADLARATAELTRQTIRAFNFVDLEQAQRVIQADDRVDALYGQMVQSALSDMRRADGRTDRDLQHVMIAKNLERVGDHCTNVAEDIVYIKRGEIVRHRHAV